MECSKELAFQYMYPLVIEYGKNRNCLNVVYLMKWNEITRNNLVHKEKMKRTKFSNFHSLL